MAWIEKRSGKHLVRWREPDGSAHSKTCRTKEEARAFRARVESELLEGTYVPQEGRKQAFGAYAREILTGDLHLEKSTRYQQMNTFRLWIEPTIGHIPLGSIDTPTLRRAFAEMQKAGGSDARIIEVRKVLRKVLRRAIAEGLIRRNPMETIPPPKTTPTNIRILTPEEVQAVSSGHGYPYWLIPLLSAWGTFRIGEVCALRVSDIDGDRITVRHTVATAGGTTYLKEPKTKASRRTNKMPEWIMTLVRERILALEHGETFLFKTPRGNLLSHLSYHPMWRKALKAAYFPEPWPRVHDLRHTAVAIMIRAGADPKQIQARCGHSTIGETYDTYGHLFPGHDDELVRTLESFRPQEAEVIELG